jgi:serine/threonine-protein kinase
MALVVVMALVIGGLVVALVLKRTGEHVSPTTTVQPGGESSTTASTSTSVSSSTTSTTEPTTTTTTTTVVPVDPEGAAFAAIDQFATGDRAQVESLSGSWVPQVSTKAAGLEVNGVVFDWRMTLSDHEQLRSRYDAIVLRSGDFNYAKAGFYVTVVPTAYSTPEEANGWCDSQGIGADDCFAKRIRVGPYSTADVVYRK